MWRLRPFIFLPESKPTSLDTIFAVSTVLLPIIASDGEGSRYWLTRTHKRNRLWIRCYVLFFLLTG